MVAKQVVCDPEEVRLECGVASETLSALDAGHEGLLDQVFERALVHLVAEESVHAREVAVEQLIARAQVPAAPTFEQLDIVPSIDH